MSNPLRRMFETDQTVEKEGVIVQYATGVEIRIARAGGSNKKFSKAVTRLTQPYRRAIQTETLDEEISARLMREAYASAVVIGWKGITKDLVTHDDADAEIELEFNMANCIAVFKEQPNLFDDVQASAGKISIFRAAILEGDSGNS